MSNVILEVRELTTKYITRFREDVYAVDHVSLKVEEGKSLGIAGESGCGKSTLALSLMGYLDVMSRLMYLHLGATTANTGVGILSSVIDNIPVMFAVLSMHPDMSIGQWLLVTLTAGIGGSLLSVGSAAGVALMGQSRGAYTFSAHLKWTPVIAIGYAVAIVLHLMINASMF